MMQTIHKYLLDENRDITEVEMPGGAIILHVHEQNNRPCVWAKVRTESVGGTPTVRIHRFLTVGTGNEIKVNDEDIPGYTCRELVYRGSAHLDGGALVAHIFEVLVDAKQE